MGGTARSVVVTGASSGIGRATACAFARAGHRVVLGARRAEECARLASVLRDEGHEAFAARLDLRDPDSVAAFAARAQELAGPVDVLVSNAGDARPSPALTADPAALAAILDVNVVGAAQLASLLVPPMIERGAGDVVLVSSEIVGAAPRPRMAPYSASKHALEAWAAVLQAELEGTGVRASVVRPGATVTDQAADWDPDVMAEMFGMWERRGVVSHWGLLQPDDVAAAVLTVVSAPPHVHLRLLEVLPTAPVTAG